MIARWLSRLTLNQKLGALALLLGAGAIFTAPTRGGAVSLDPAELAVIVQREVDHVRVEELADWIVQGRADYRLVDLRDEKAYAEYHIPGAELIPVTGLDAAPLARNEKVVLYSDGGIHSAQAWFLLRARGYQGVYILLGGLDAWRDEVLFPTLADSLTPFQAERNAKLQARAVHFGGQARAAAAASAGGELPAAGTTPAAVAGAPALSAIAPPAAVASAAGAAAPAKKKKEGC
jgi:rhodanese-related sulfurtransferase